MFSLLPDLAPRDSYSLWYTSSRNPLATYDVNLHSNDNPSTTQGANQRRHTQFLERSPLARLRADEQTLDRRLHNVSSFGCTWLKPPGIPKTLHQMREERREQEEHQEALRREQLAQELAEAEAAGLDNFEGGPEGQGEDGMDDVQLDGARDLDEDIPEANDADFALSGDDEDDDEDDEEEGGEGEQGMAQRAARTQQALMAQRMRQAGGEAASGGNGFYGGEDEVDEEDQAHLIQEDDEGGDADGVEMDMDADLDNDIPEAESALGGYEHTDSEAELSSSTSSDDEDRAEMSFARPRAPQANRFRNSLARSDVTRQSIAVSDLLSRDESSFFDSSPEVPRHGARPSRS